MCEALKELMKDEIEEARKKAWEEGREEGREEGITEMIYSLVSEGDIFPERGAQKLGISVEQLNSDMDAWAERMAYYGDYKNVLSPDKQLTEDQILMIKEAAKRSLALDDDNPELTDEQLALFCGVHESRQTD